VPVALGILGALVFLGAIGTAAVLGLKVRRQTLADREMQSRRAMIVMMTATLGKETDESLEKIRNGGGLTGEAAGLILKGRHAKTDAKADE
jgi:O-antigen ligase